MFQYLRIEEPLTPTLSPRSAGRGRGESNRVTRAKHSPLQEFAGLVQRTKGNPGLRKVFAGALIAVHHGEDQNDLGAQLAHRFHRLQRRAPGGGDVLATTTALPLQAIAFCETFDRKPGAMLLGFLAHEEGRDRMALEP